MTDDSEKQNRAVMKEMDKAWSEEGSKEDDSVCRRHHEFQESLQAHGVCIPYRDKLSDSLPARIPASRRAYEQLGATIEAVTLLHQYQREKNKDGRLMATVYDYAIARWLLVKPLTEALGKSLGIEDSTWHAYDRLLRYFPALDYGDGFTSTEALAVFRCKPTRDAELKKLCALGALQCTVKASGNNPSRYRWTDRELSELILPSVASVEEFCVSV
jgi:hypothetical protein